MINKSLPQHPTPPPLVKVSGSHREMGRQIGQTCAAQVRHSIENARVLLDKAYDKLELTWSGAQIQARKYSVCPGTLSAICGRTGGHCRGIRCAF